MREGRRQGRSGKTGMIWVELGDEWRIIKECEESAKNILMEQFRQHVDQEQQTWVNTSSFHDSHKTASGQSSHLLHHHCRFQSNRPADEEFYSSGFKLYSTPFRPIHVLFTIPQWHNVLSSHVMAKQPWKYNSGPYTPSPQSFAFKIPLWVKVHWENEKDCELKYLFYHIVNYKSVFQAFENCFVFFCLTHHLNYIFWLLCLFCEILQIFTSMVLKKLLDEGHV